ncbi:enoyl-CoA hydratase/isomerase family protein [Sphingomonas sp. CGMCC 1.13654]|uniref:Enoyl-CoA hydratase/isomerase family protein n=1 Tax=Sphingomonas chungangi TaxID=2683589 RepID=A0A838L4A6_9SPHN|nr:enoyl-CoA hydratase-related protein [Sphingomonas chungangi]MBA2933740.1 enoyl-CoA hydratase/isomerase family protein [Sphingomonas chungangi]MVW55071.1 enoyl-CoA hydratase [Sphingomonas chungangi]
MTMIADLIDGRTDPLLIADRGAVRVVILNRPDARNALTRQMRRDFAALLAEADADAAISVIVLTGADPAFSGGVDLRETIAGRAAPVEPNPGVALRRVAKPVIAAINGACITGALEMMLSCGFAIASDRARFADTHGRVGLFPRWGQGMLLTDAIGVRRARQMMLTGLPVDAATALDWCLINEVVAHDTLIARALELAEAIAMTAGDHPLPFRLHVDMLREIGAVRAAGAAVIERTMLHRFDEQRGIPHIGKQWDRM